jgi:hypothetical protein
MIFSRYRQTRLEFRWQGMITHRHEAPYKSFPLLRILQPCSWGNEVNSIHTQPISTIQQPNFKVNTVVSWSLEHSFHNQMSCRDSVRTSRLHQTQDFFYKKKKKKSYVPGCGTWESPDTMIIGFFFSDMTLQVRVSHQCAQDVTTLYFLRVYYFQIFYNKPSYINHFSRPTDTASLSMVGNLFFSYNTYMYSKFLLCTCVIYD